MLQTPSWPHIDLRSTPFNMRHEWLQFTVMYKMNGHTMHILQRHTSRHATNGAAHLRDSTIRRPQVPQAQHDALHGSMRRLTPRLQLASRLILATCHIEHCDHHMSDIHSCCLPTSALPTGSAKACVASPPLPAIARFSICKQRPATRKHILRIHGNVTHVVDIGRVKSLLGKNRAYVTGTHKNALVVFRGLLVFALDNGPNARL